MIIIMISYMVTQKKNEYQLHIPHFKACLRLLGLKLRLTFTENQKFFS
jgi:hypothetical protein